jgi:uncharacterized protein (TIGR02588 family)
MGGKMTSHTLSGTERALQTGMAALGAILLLGSLAVVIQSALGPVEPAMVEVREVERDVVAGRTRVEVQAVNRGGVTASAVTIEGRNRADDLATVTLDYVPGRSSKTATLTFAGDIGETPVALQATGWVDP